MAKRRTTKSTTPKPLSLLARIKKLDAASTKAFTAKLSPEHKAEFNAAIKAVRAMPDHVRPSYPQLAKEMTAYFGVKVSEYSLRRYVSLMEEE